MAVMVQATRFVEPRMAHIIALYLATRMDNVMTRLGVIYKIVDPDNYFS